MGRAISLTTTITLKIMWRILRTDAIFEATNSEVFFRLLSLQRRLLTFALSGWVWVNQALLFDDCG